MHTNSAYITDAAADFQKRLQRLSEPIQVFWGQSFKISVQKKTEAPSFSWNDISISMADCDERDEKLVFALLHEFGHRFIAPQTAPLHHWWRILARLEGIEADQLAVNLAADLLVDSWYLNNARWRTVYQKNEKQFIQNTIRKINRKPSPFLAFILYCQSLMLGVAETLPFETSKETATQAMSHLFDAGLTMDQRLQRYFRLLAKLMNRNTPASINAETLKMKGNEGTRSSFNPQPINWRLSRRDIEALIRKLRSKGIHLPDADRESIFGKKTAKEIGSRLRLLETLVAVASNVSRFQVKQDTPHSEGHQLWRIGEAAHHLQAQATLERAGIMLPGINTLKRRPVRTSNDQNQISALRLVVDDSASTSGPILRQQLNAAIALLEVARRIQIDVGLVVFGSDVSNTINPCREYTRIELVLAALEGQSGGTCLAPALIEAAGFKTKTHNRVSTVVFTDSYVADVAASIPPVRKMIADGPVVFFCVENLLDSDLVAALKAMPQPPTIIQVEPGVPLVDQALLVLR
jgi:hypothetical protein